MPRPSAQTLVRVAVVEDDSAFLRQLRAAVDSAPELLLGSVATTRAEALRALEGDAADVLVVDLGLPDGSGIDVIRAARQAWPACAIMVSTSFADELHVIESIEAGASGYLLKDSSVAGLTEGIRSLHAGESPITPRVARHVLRRFQADESGPSTAPREGAGSGASALSARELEVLRYITKGFTYDEIADLLKVSGNTVRTFVRRAYEKLEVRSKIEAINEARKQGLLGE